jgi:hypothetical protein
MRKVIKYKTILFSHKLNDSVKPFTDAVNEAIANGWELCGGVSISNAPNGDMVIAQAVVKYADEPHY